MNLILLTLKQDRKRALIADSLVFTRQGTRVHLQDFVIDRRVDMSDTKTTTDHAQIKRWVEERGGRPARVKGTAEKGSSGVLVIDYPGYSGTQTLEAISWEEFFQGFEENNLAFLYQGETKGGDKSRFSKLINRDSAEDMSRGASS